jgi:hypothetical protein
MHFPHLSLVDDWLEEGMVMEMGSQHEQAPVSEAAIIEGNTVLGFEVAGTLVIFLHHRAAKFLSCVYDDWKSNKVLVVLTIDCHLHALCICTV